MSEFRSRFRPAREADVLSLIAKHPLAWVVSPGTPGAGAATPLPLLAETDDDGGVRALFGHFAKRNPQVATLERDPRAMILFQGPEGYIPARLVADQQWGPTWNYATAWFETEVTFVPEETESAVRRLAAHLEGARLDAWTPDVMGERLDELLPRIIAFRARVLGSEVVFKLGQDEKHETFGQIVERLENRALADAMRDQAVDRPRPTNDGNGPVTETG